MKNQRYFILLLIVLFAIRLLYGLSHDFWSEDELQLYLIGLKSFLTDTWPYYGPDVVYTKTQIAGALQGLLIRVPLEILPIPESPIIFLNVLSFASLSLLAHYLTQRISAIPRWMIWTFVLMNTWAMHYGTRIYNPTYALVFSIPFFVCAIELFGIYKKQLVNTKLAFLIMGISITSIMQLHLSWVILIPFSLMIFVFRLKDKLKSQLANLGVFLLGLLLGAATLIPTLFNPTEQADVNTNIVFRIENWSNFFSIIVKFLAFATNEVNMILFSNPGGQLSVFEDQLWLAPFAIVLLLGQFMILGLLFVSFFIKGSYAMRKIKIIVFATIILLYFSFFFSIKSPTPHTIFILYPIALIFAFHCFEWALRWKFSLRILKLISISLLLFHFGNGLHKMQHNSILMEREKVLEAIEAKDYKMIDHRRTDHWGYGY